MFARYDFKGKLTRRTIFVTLTLLLRGWLTIHTAIAESSSIGLRSMYVWSHNCMTILSNESRFLVSGIAKRHLNYSIIVSFLKTDFIWGHNNCQGSLFSDAQYTVTQTWKPSKKRNNIFPVGGSSINFCKSSSVNELSVGNAENFAVCKSWDIVLKRLCFDRRILIQVSNKLA